MPDVYAASFSVRSKPDQDPEEVFTTAIRRWVGEHDGEPKDLKLAEPSVVRAGTGSLFRWEPYCERERCLLDFTWRHPDLTRPGVSWATRATYLQLGASGYISLQVSNTGPEIRDPGTLLTTRPRLLLHLLEHIELRSDGVSIALTPEVLNRTRIRSFVRYELLDPDRRIPIVVASPNEGTDFPVPVATIAKELASLAKLYAIADAGTTYELTAELGRRQLSCFHGALRVYFSGFTLEADPYSHPLLVLRRATDYSERLRLCQRLALLTTRRYTTHPAIAVLRDEREFKLSVERDAIRADLQARRKEALAQADYEQLAEMAWSEAETLSSRLDDVQARVEELTAKLKWAEKDRRRLQLRLLELGSAEADVGSDDQLSGFQPKDVFEAVETAAELFADDLHFLPSAFETAQASPFARPLDVFQALRVTAEVSSLSRAGSIGKPLRDAFRERGVEYAGGLSETTSKKMRRKFRFSGGGTEFACEEHLRLGSSSYDPAECLRIYISTVERCDEKFVIGHVGRHLDVMTTT